jgi:hypothetical protein
MPASVDEIKEYLEGYDEQKYIVGSIITLPIQVTLQVYEYALYMLNNDVSILNELAPELLLAI